MKSASPEISIIIPSYNRCTDLQRALSALTHQTCPFETMEIVVVLDGSTDGSAEMVRSLDIPCSLRLIEQENSGLTVSRNRGAEEASGRVLVYQDDDIAARPGMVEAYLQAHADGQEKLAIGYSPPVIEDPPGWLGIIHRMWWEDRFRDMADPGWRFGYQDLMGCNFSITRSLYLRLGGMDAGVSSFSREDWEFSVRLVKSGARIEYTPEACGDHHVSFSVQRGLQRKTQEGRAETRMVKVHPEIWPTVGIFNPAYTTFFMGRVVRRLAFSMPHILRPPVGFLLRQLYVFINTFYLHAWSFRMFYGLEAYWYWLGVAEELDRFEDMDVMKQHVLECTETPLSASINLADGLAAVEKQVDSIRPDALHIYLEDMYIGLIPDKPGGERLRGAHLRPYILQNFSEALAVGLALTAQPMEDGEPGVFLDQFLQRKSS